MVPLALTLVVGLVVLGSSVWVLIDAHRLGLRAGRDGKRRLLSNDPATWFFGCILLWIVVFPLYLVARTKSRGGRWEICPAAAADGHKSAVEVAFAATPRSGGAPEWVGATALALGIMSIPAAIVGILGAPLWFLALAFGAWGTAAGGPGRRMAMGGVVAGMAGFLAMLTAIVMMAMWMQAGRP